MTANQARFWAIALAACWALIIVPIAYVTLKGRSHPDWNDVTIPVAIGASALVLALIQNSITSRRGR
jgi:peptidoglycan/LPS O-acetylase OafA/YrhL